MRSYEFVQCAYYSISQAHISPQTILTNSTDSLNTLPYAQTLVLYRMRKLCFDSSQHLWLYHQC